MPTCFTHHWYAPYPWLICALRALSNLRALRAARIRGFTLINRCLTHVCFVLLQISLCLSDPLKKVEYSEKRPWTQHLQRCEFSALDRKHPFWANLAQKIKIVESKLKFGTQSNLNMQNSMVMFTFSVFDQKYPFRAKLVQKTKILSLTWNLVPRLIQICKIQWWCSLFLF